VGRTCQFGGEKGKKWRKVVDFGGKWSKVVDEAEIGGFELVSG
jgi:hypothetical protein